MITFLPEIFIFLFIFTLIFGFILWHYLPIFILVVNGIYFVAGMTGFAGTEGISVILFIFNIPSFAVIGLYCFIYYGFFATKTKITEIELPTFITDGKRRL
jgi:hypothetical protein